MITCVLCELEVEYTTRHHLIPRTVHKNKWFKKNFTKAERDCTVDLCKLCHKQIHLFFSEKELGRFLNTISLLQANEKVQNFLVWRRNQH